MSDISDVDLDEAEQVAANNEEIDRLRKEIIRIKAQSFSAKGKADTALRTQAEAQRHLNVEISRVVDSERKLGLLQVSFYFPPPL